jgi:predicted Zn-dependent protease
MFKPSKADQVKLGLRAASEIRRKERVLPGSDPRVEKVREVAARLLAANPDGKNEPWNYSFDVISNKQINAFALPGGPVFFYTGLLDRFRTEDQLAAVLAHELVHVRREHWAYAYADQQKRSLGLSVLLLLFRANRTVTDIASISNELLLTLPYARGHETQADDAGFEMMVRAGYNPQGMADVFKMLRQSSSGGKPPEFLSTHPDDRGRINRIEEKVRRSERNFRPQVPLRFDGSVRQSR